jgi:hypothetical protein
VVRVHPRGHYHVTEFQPVAQTARDADEEHRGGLELHNGPLSERGGGQIAHPRRGDGNLPIRARLEDAHVEQRSRPVRAHLDFGQVAEDRCVLALQSGQDHDHGFAPSRCFVKVCFIELTEVDVAPIFVARSPERRVSRGRETELGPWRDRGATTGTDASPDA